MPILSNTIKTLLTVVSCNLVTSYFVKNAEIGSLFGCSMVYLPASKIISKITSIPFDTYVFPKISSEHKEYASLGFRYGSMGALIGNCITNFEADKAKKCFNSDDLIKILKAHNVQNLDKFKTKIDTVFKNMLELHVANPGALFLNLLAQTVLIDIIWNGLPWSNDKAQDLPEIECIIQDDYELGVQPQDFDYNEYVMAAG